MVVPVDAFPRARLPPLAAARHAAGWEAGLAWVLYIVMLARVVTGVVPYLGTGTMEAFLVYTLLAGPLLHGTKEADLGIGKARDWKARLRPVPRHGPRHAMVLAIASHALVLVVHLAYFDDTYRMLPGIGHLNGWIRVHAPWLAIPAALVEFGALHLVARPLMARPDGMHRALAGAGRFMIPFVAALVALSAASGFAFAPVDPLVVVATWHGYVFWAAIQQLPFLWYFANRFREALPAGRGGDAASALLVAIPFSLMHAPQWPLVLVTLVMETILAWCFVTGRARNLLAVAWFHALVGTVLVHFTGMYMVTYGY